MIDELLYETYNPQIMSTTQRKARIISSSDIGGKKKAVVKLGTKYYLYKY